MSRGTEATEPEDRRWHSARVFNCHTLRALLGQEVGRKSQGSMGSAFKLARAQPTRSLEYANQSRLNPCLQHLLGTRS